MDGHARSWHAEQVQDGQRCMTAYRRLKGKDHEVKVAEFGECVLYMTPGITGKDKLDARWENGIWLGIRDRSGEIIVGTPEGCMKVRSVRRRPEGERWNKDDGTACEEYRGR